MDWWESLEETMDFPMKYGWFPGKISFKLIHLTHSLCCPEGALGAALHRSDLAGHVPHSAASWLLIQLEFQQFWFYLMDFDVSRYIHHIFS